MGRESKSQISAEGGWSDSGGGNGAVAFGGIELSLDETATEGNFGPGITEPTADRTLARPLS